MTSHWLRYSTSARPTAPVICSEFWKESAREVLRKRHCDPPFIPAMAIWKRKWPGFWSANTATSVFCINQAFYSRQPDRFVLMSARKTRAHAHPLPQAQTSHRARHGTGAGGSACADWGGDCRHLLRPAHGWRLLRLSTRERRTCAICATRCRRPPRRDL